MPRTSWKGRLRKRRKTNYPSPTDCSSGSEDDTPPVSRKGKRNEQDREEEEEQEDGSSDEQDREEESESDCGGTNKCGGDSIRDNLMTALLAHAISNLTREGPDSMNCSGWCSLPSSRQNSEEEEDSTDEEWVPNRPQVPSRTETVRRSTRNQRAPEVDPPFVPTDLKSLIRLAELQEGSTENFRDCSALVSLLPVLRDLENLIGMEEVKSQVVKMVLQQCQPLLSQPRMSHIVIYGKPGIGKTTLAGILARLIAVMGNTKSPVLVHASAANMVAGFLGQTAGKVEALVDRAIGGVLLIDEASSLSDGRTEGSGDSFSKSAIDQLNRLLTEKGHLFTCILAGYEHEIQRDFMNVNPGLRRRFGTVLKLSDFTAPQLVEITQLQLKSKLKLVNVPTVPVQWFQGLNCQYFNNMAGDVEVLVNHIIDEFGLVVFGSANKQDIPTSVLERGFSEFVKTKRSVLGAHAADRPPEGMYI